MKPQQNKVLMACFDLPCGALFGGPSRWPETNLKGNRCPPSAITRSQTSLSLISRTPQNSRSVCAESATHQNAAFKKADLNSVVFRNL